MATLLLANGQTMRGPLDAARVVVSSGSRSVTLTPSGDRPRVVSFERIFETQPAVYAAVSKLTHQIATLPIRAFVEDSQGKPVRARGHAVERLVNKPLPRRSGLSFKQWMARPALVHGNSLLAKFRADGNDRPPTNVLPLRWPTVNAYAQLGGFVEYWETTQLGDRVGRLPVDESLHFGWESGDGELGVSPLQVLEVEIVVADAMQRYGRAMFQNGARPSGLVVMPPGAKDEEIEEAKQGIKALHEGVDNFYRVALAAGGADWKPLSFNANEAQLIEQRRVNLEEIARVFDVPPPLLGDLTHGTYSNVSELHRMLYVTVLRPWLTFFEETLQAQLIDPEDEWASEGVFLRFDLSEVLRGDRTEQIAAVAQAFTNGLLTLNQSLEELGMATSNDEWADKHFIPSNNMQPLGADIRGRGEVTPPREAPGA
jgi:HK97 family phage portal protein